MKQTVLYHDAIARNIWRSDNEGKEWKVVEDIPLGESWNLVEHPFDTTIVSALSLISRYTNQGGVQAFVLTKEKRHYRTINRGLSWQSFDVPSPPTLGALALSFHSYVFYTLHSPRELSNGK